jgi:hypothetical protein
MLARKQMQLTYASTAEHPLEAAADTTMCVPWQLTAVGRVVQLVLATAGTPAINAVHAASYGVLMNPLLLLLLCQPRMLLLLLLLLTWVVEYVVCLCPYGTFYDLK